MTGIRARMLALAALGESCARCSAPSVTLARSIRPLLVLLPRSPGVASPAGTSRLMLAGFTPRLRYLSASKSLFVQFQCPISFGGRVLLSGMG